MYVQLGDNQVSLTLNAVRKNFEIDSTSEDSQLLELVSKSLPLVKRIRPGDSIPKEVLDGTASWSVEDHHRIMSKTRMVIALAQQIMGEEQVVPDARKLIELAEDPEVKKKAKEGIEKIAEANGFDKGKHHLVVSMIDQLSDELSYIEALKEHFLKVNSISQRLKDTQKTFGEDKGLCEEIDRIHILLKGPFKHYRKIFVNLSNHITDINEVVQSFSTTIELIRKSRDQLRSSFMDWEELVQNWQDQTLERDSGVEGLVRDTYRFVATNFPQTQGWHAA